MDNKNLKNRLISRDGFKCAVSEEVVDSLDQLDIHHVLPRSKGGTDDLSNLILVTSEINTKLTDHVNLNQIKDSLPGMREGGSVEEGTGYFIAEYESRGLRLKELAEEVKVKIASHFLLYDYKAIILTDNLDVKNYLTKMYSDGFEVDGDSLHVSSDLLSYNNPPTEKLIDYAKEIYNYEISKLTEKNRNVILNPSIDIKIKSKIKPVLGVEAIADTLASIIIEQPDDSGMMIGIFGKWGRGKTFLADKTWAFIKKIKPNYHRAVFSAWKYQDTKASWAYLYETLLEEYLIVNDAGRFRKITNFFKYNLKLWNINVNKYQLAPVFILIATLSFGFLWTFFVDKFSFINTLIGVFGFVTLMQMFLFYIKYKSSVSGLYKKYFSKKSFSEYLGLQSEVESEITNLLQAWIPKINSDEKVVLFVDDIDRCNIEQVINIVDGLRVILDNPEINKRLIIVTAIDESILKYALSYKYSSFSKEAHVDDMYKEYLEKIFLIGLRLNNLSDFEIKDFLHNIMPVNKNTDDSKNANHSVTESIFNDHTSNSIQSTVSDIVPNNKLLETNYNEGELDLNDYEREYISNAIINLKNATPRKIRIFYYKYLIMKKLFHIKLYEKDLLDFWDNSCDEKIIIDTLIHLSNGESVHTFQSNRDDEVIDAIKYTAEMVSVL